jgi:hypothetical protein
MIKPEIIPRQFDREIIENSIIIIISIPILIGLVSCVIAGIALFVFWQFLQD